MTTDRNNLKAGIFILVSIGLIVGVVVAIKGVGTIVTRVDTRKVAFSLTDDVGGLAVGDPVRLGGVRVGAVRDISFDDATPGVDPRVVVTFTVPRKFELKEDARVAIQGTITGSAWLNIDGLGSGKPSTEAVALVGRPSAMTQLLANLGEASPQLSGLLTDVREKTIPKVNAAVDGFVPVGPEAKGLLTDVRGRTLPKVDVAVDKTASFMGKAGDLTGDVTGDFRGTVANLNAATGSIKEKVPGILEKVDVLGAKLVKTVDEAQAALQDLKATLANTKDATASAKGILVRNRGKIDDMIASLKTTGDNLKAATSEIRRSPWRLLYKPGPGEMANLNLYDAARQFADGASDLNDAAVSLRDLLQDPEADPATVKKLVEQLDATFVEFKDVETKLWNGVRQ